MYSYHSYMAVFQEAFLVEEYTMIYPLSGLNNRDAKSTWNKTDYVIYMASFDTY